MSKQNWIDLHADRAMEELDRAISAASMEAAIAHLDLSELHLDRVRSLSGIARGAMGPVAIA